MSTKDRPDHAFPVHNCGAATPHGGLPHVIGGTFTITIGDRTTPPIPQDADDATIRAAIAAIALDPPQPEPPEIPTT